MTTSDADLLGGGGEGVQSFQPSPSAKATAVSEATHGIRRPAHFLGELIRPFFMVTLTQYSNFLVGPATSFHGMISGSEFRVVSPVELELDSICFGNSLRTPSRNPPG